MMRTQKPNFFSNAVLRCKVELEHFRSEIGGVAAIEFAFIAPLMLLLYIGTIEVSGAVSTNRKLSRVSSSVGDLITQSECLTNANLADITKIADDIMYPYSGKLKLRVTGIQVEGKRAKVEWSKGYNTGAAARGSTYKVPNKIKVDGNFLVSTYVETSYQPAVGWISIPRLGAIDKDTTALMMNEEMFLRPRLGNEIVLRASC